MILIRQPTRPDLDRLVEIENACCTEQRRLGCAYYSQVWQGVSPSLVAVLDGVVVGFVICRATPDDAYIETLNVHPDFRGRGIAKLLLTTLERIVANTNVSKIVLHVEVSNKAAIHLYLNAGYTIRTKVEYYYWDKVGAFAMFKAF